MTLSDSEQTVVALCSISFGSWVSFYLLQPEVMVPPAPYPSHSLRRLPQCPPVHLRHPVPVSLTLSLSPGTARLRPPLKPLHRAPPPHIHIAPRGASFRSVPRHNSCRMVMVSDFNVPFHWNFLFDDVAIIFPLGLGSFTDGAAVEKWCCSVQLQIHSWSWFFCVP